VVIVPSLALSTRWQISSSVTPKQIGPLKGRKVPPKYRSPSGETWRDGEQGQGGWLRR
jgi:hypothetical protein